MYYHENKITIVYDEIMDLFESVTGQPRNLLPKEGVVNYYGPIMSRGEANTYLVSLINTIAWKNDEVIVFGKHIITKRQMAWYGNKPFEYTYSNTTKKALAWTDKLLVLKTMVEKNCNETFNSCLLNLYHDGREGMAWHTDNEPELAVNAAIASLSFGGERKFSFKHKDDKSKVSLILQQGSLLVMKGKTQAHWLHCMSPTTKIDKPRVNLTFRTIIPS